jgi:hypothetical protein
VNSKARFATGEATTPAARKFLLAVAAMRLPSPLAVLVVSVLVIPIVPRLAEAAQGAVGLNDQPAELRAASQVEGLEFKMLDKLPKAPASAQKREGCENYIIVPATVAGKEAAARGWAVTAEAKMGIYETVSFSGKFHLDDDGYTSHYCTVMQGNVGVFHDGELVALAYASPSSKQTIGKVVELEGGGVRVWNGEDISAPIADIAVVDDGYLLQLETAAAQETLCGGKITVPNIYGLPIDKARAALIAKGWSPLPRDNSGASGEDDQEKKLVKRGVVEIDSCSEGLDFCEFNYTGQGVGLDVTTIGDADFPKVINYRAQCSK